MYYINRAIEIAKNEGIRVLISKIKRKLKWSTPLGPVTALDPEWYIQLNENVEKQRVGRYNNPEIETIRLKSSSSRALYVPFHSDFRNKSNPSTKKIAAIVHIFYPDLCPRILSYLGNLPPNSDVYISTNTEGKKISIEQQFVSYTNGKVHVRVFPNKGRDIGPFLSGFKDVFKNYEYFVHIHSKKSPHSISLDEWGEYCYKNLLGSKAIVNSILELLSYEKIGIVSAAHYKKVQDCINWGYDFTNCRNIVRKLGADISSDTLLDFPSSSMFWGKTAALDALLNLNLSFEEENGKIDGTVAHAVERSFFYACELAGFRWIRVSNEKENKQTVLDYSPTKFFSSLEKIYFPLFNRYVHKAFQLDKKYPEQIQVNTYPIDDNSRLRINLIVPTINSSQIFGGISTALKLFNELKTTLDKKADFRIIVSDSILDSDAKVRYADFYLEQPVYENDSLHFQVISIADRYNSKIYLRKNDIFIATAWWTAKLANDLRHEIERYYAETKDIIYLIQDSESNFYPWSSKWGMCNDTYKYSNIIAIINSIELAQYMTDRFNFKKVFVLPYQLNASLASKYKPNNLKKKQLIFYGRPSVERNCFELVTDGIALWQSRNPIESKCWDVISLGEKYNENNCPCVRNLKVLGKLDLESYANILNESAIGLSLMVSPHPSYPPLEMANFGCITISNKYLNKDLRKRSNNILNLELFSASSVADAIEEAVSRYETNKATLGLNDIDQMNFSLYSANSLIAYVHNLSD